ncbi:type IX secretion system outer membrane channel protein PorV [Dyadobacter flavalbus]|uniref:Type IX secretion system outer membrane channel protein PorV n=1 Tax=Dyadobacter flavalbus TaxID=2579942 RepID=A0A5M8QWE2_9BACT|nr:type IX secretion system outer membrane channel protein PorV [Dyadobacter flavalbus]KAA6438966.1 type IX secretion system outer membrane channel protein PorV [Dyadobacter flavalbus]
MKLFQSGLFCLFLFSNTELSAQSMRIPSSQLLFLQRAPDARSAAMGEAGVALSADANATFWNASKLSFAEKDFGASVSYLPWLRKVVPEMWQGYGTAYKKLAKGQAMALSFNYMNNAEVDFPGYAFPQQLPPFEANQSAISGTYSRQLGNNFSMGFTLKYIASRLTEDIILGNIEIRNAQTMAGDLSAYYRKQLTNETTGKEVSWSLGAVLSNAGGKINYGAGTETDDFLPTTLKVGGGFSFTENGKHRFNFILDAIKLMVPTPQYASNVNNKPLLSGVLGSFTDAPGGFREEMQEVALAAGGEYWYKGVLALRGGYFGENKNKGNLKYFTTGAGLRILKNYTADFACLFPVEQGSPLAQTFRLTASVHL